MLLFTSLCYFAAPLLAAAMQVDASEIPEHYLPYIIKYLNGFSNDTVDFSKPYMNPYFVGIYPIFVAVYGVLIVSSTLANLAMVYHIARYKRHKDPTCAFLINIAIANFIHVGIALPITLTVLLMQNWIFGQFVCFGLPILQDIPIHVSMMTYLLIAGDRYRLLSDPRKPRIPAFVCALGTWFFGVCIVLPYPIYTTYIDLQSYTPPEQSTHPIRGVKMCIANLADDIQEYMRSLFIGTYVAPLTITAYLYVKSGQELQSLEGPLAVAVYEARGASRQGSSASNDVALTIQAKRGSESVGNSGTPACSNLSTSYDVDDAEIDVPKEKRTQKYLIFMVSSFAVCLCPLMILRLARSALDETYENAPHFDITYVMLVWVGFLPSLITPCLYASWQMSRPAKERLRGYFRFSNRRHTRVLEDGHRIPGRARRLRGPSGSLSGGTQRSRADSGNSTNGSVTAVIVTNSPRSSTVVALGSPDLSSTGYSTYKGNYSP